MKNTKSTYDWLCTNFENGEKITDHENTVLRILKPYNPDPQLTPAGKLRPVTDQDVEDWKKSVWAHKLTYVAKILQVHHDSLKKKVNGFKCDLSNPNFTFKTSCKFCTVKLPQDDRSPSPSRKKPIEVAVEKAKERCQKHTIWELSHILKVDPKTLGKYLANFPPIEKESCDFCIKIPDPPTENTTPSRKRKRAQSLPPLERNSKTFPSEYSKKITKALANKVSKYPMELLKKSDEDLGLWDQKIKKYLPKPP